MKAVVVEIEGKQMVVVDQKGCFQNIKYNGKSKIGEEIEMIDSRTNVLVYMKRITAAAAMLLVVSGSVFGVSSYYSPYAYLDVDINPSLEIVLNRYMRVLDVNSFNEDGKKIASNKAELKNKKMEEAVDKLLDNAKKEKILTADKENAVLFTVASSDDASADNINKKIEKTAQKKIDQLKVKCEVLPTEKVTVKKNLEAKKINVSPGRVILYEKLKQVEPEAKLEDVLKAPVKETVKKIIEIRKQKNEIKAKPEKENGVQNGKEQDKKANTDAKTGTAAERSKVKERIINKIGEQNQAAGKSRQGNTTTNGANNKTNGDETTNQNDSSGAKERIIERLKEREQNIQNQQRENGQNGGTTNSVEENTDVKNEQSSGNTTNSIEENTGVEDEQDSGDTTNSVEESTDVKNEQEQSLQKRRQLRNAFENLKEKEALTE